MSVCYCYNYLKLKISFTPNPEGRLIFRCSPLRARPELAEGDGAKKHLKISV